MKAQTSRAGSPDLDRGSHQGLLAVLAAFLRSLPAPRLSSLRRDLDAYLRYYNYDRVHHGRLTAGQIPADIVYGARKMEVK